VIVVIGTPWLRVGPDGGAVAGLAGRIAVEAARAGSEVQLVGKVGDDGPGDELVLALAREGVAHVAVLRPPSARTPVLVGAPETEPADLDPLGAALVLETTVVTGPEGPDPTLSLDAADLELALRYLVDFRAIVVAESLEASAGRVITEASRYAGAHVIAVAAPGSDAPGLDGATVLTSTDLDPDGALVGVVAAFATAIDRGEDPEAALSEAIAVAGVDRAGDG
jgi:hypothetical protein